MMERTLKKVKLWAMSFFFVLLVRVSIFEIKVKDRVQCVFLLLQAQPLASSVFYFKSKISIDSISGHLVIF